MKKPPHKRASPEYISFPTETLLAASLPTEDNPHDAIITPKLELKKRSGELGPDDSRFIGY
jgi:hypothetical protein